MDEQHDFGKCEICGKPATLMLRDLNKWDGGAGFWEFAHTGPIHRFCDEHKRDPAQTDISLSPIAWSRLTKEEKKNYGK